MDHAPGSVLGDLALRTVLGVKITDRETQQPAGMLIVGHAEPRKWKANETYFMQAIGDQMLMSVSHTRLRSLVRRMGVSDERSGLLSRSSYQSCLLTEADRARTQGTPLALTILQIDRGGELLRQQGESPMERFLEQLARSLLIFGMHVHVAMPDKQTTIDMMNMVRYFLPHLLALSTSSPFWMGRNTGLKSFRTTVFRRFPRIGVPEQFESWSAYENFLSLL